MVELLHLFAENRLERREANQSARSGTTTPGGPVIQDGMIGLTNLCTTGAPLGEQDAYSSVFQQKTRLRVSPTESRLGCLQSFVMFATVSLACGDQP